MKNFSFCISLICLLLSSCSDSSTEKENPKTILAFHLEKGTKKEMKYDITYASPNSKAVFNYHLDYTIESMQMDDKSTDLKFTFNDISFDGHVDTINFSLNAAKPDSTQATFFVYAEPYFSILNHEFLLKYDQKLQKISDEVLTKIDAQAITKPVNRAPFFITLPNENISVGFKWKSQLELKSGEGMTVNAEFEVKKIEKSSVFVEFKGDVDGKGESFGLKFDLKGSVFGKAEIDLATGLPLHCEMIQDLTQKMGDSENPLHITINQNLK